MALLKKIVEQSSFYLLGNIVSIIIGFFFKIYVSNILGTEAIGLYALGITMIGVLGIFFSFGFGNGLVRFVSKYNATNNFYSIFNYIANTTFINFCVVVPVSISFFLFPEFIAYKILNTPQIEPYIPLFAVMMFVNSFLVICEQIIRGLQEVKKNTIINTFLRLPLKVGLTMLFFSMGWGLNGFIISEFLAAFLALILLLILIKKSLPYFRCSVLKFPSFNEEEKKYSFNLLITNCIYALVSHGDKIILIYYLSISELGIYSVVLTIATFVPLVLSSVNSIFSPIISQLYSQNKLKELKYYFQLSGRFVFILSFPLIVFLFLFSEPIMALFGNDFIRGSSLLSLIILGQFINISMGSVGLMLQMTGLEKPMRNVLILSSVISFTLYFLFIESWGLVGLGIVYVFNNLFQNFACTYILNRRLNIFLFQKEYVKVLLLFLALAIVFYVFFNKIIFIIGPFQLIILLVFIYIVFFFLWMFFFSKKELPLILKTINFKS
jgi:O-antigen/teichoic acid export membrane protein